MEYEKMYQYENKQYLYEDRFCSEDEWLEDLSPNVLEAYHEYTSNKDDKEDY